MDKPLKEQPLVGACGLGCGLCPRYFTGGTSRCPGCSGPDFWEKHPPCGFITCAVIRKGLETCAECPEFEGCGRVARLLEEAKTRDSFISYRPVEANLRLVRERGIGALAQEIAMRQALLAYLLEHYDEGRSKSFYCTSVALLPLARLEDTVRVAEVALAREASLMEKAKAIRTATSRLAEGLGIDLKLRKG